MWIDHLKLALVWVLFIGTVVFTAFVGDVFPIALIIGLFGIFGSFFYAIHTTYDWLVLYT